MNNIEEDEYYDYKLNIEENNIVSIVERGNTIGKRYVINVSAKSMNSGSCTEYNIKLSLILDDAVVTSYYGFDCYYRLYLEFTYNYKNYSISAEDLFKCMLLRQEQKTLYDIGHHYNNYDKEFPLIDFIIDFIKFREEGDCLYDTTSNTVSHTINSIQTNNFNIKSDSDNFITKPIKIEEILKIE